MLTIVESHLSRHGIRCCVIKGNVTPKNRADIVDAFNSDPCGPQVLLLSLRAGGVGLNLVGGNHLFLIDMHWCVHVFSLLDIPVGVSVRAHRS